MLEAIPITQARKNFLPLIKRVVSDFFNFIVTKQGKPVAVILNYQEYSRMIETLGIIKNDKLVQEVRGGLEHIRQNHIAPLKEE